MFSMMFVRTTDHASQADRGGDGTTSLASKLPARPDAPDREHAHVGRIHEEVEAHRVRHANSLLVGPAGEDRCCGVRIACLDESQEIEVFTLRED